MIERSRIIDHRGVSHIASTASLAWPVRVSLWRTCRWRWAWSKGLMAGIFFFAMFSVPAVSLTRSNDLVAVWLGGTGLIVGVGGAIISGYNSRRVREWLARVGRQCRRCDYSLVGSLKAGRCPECELAFEDDLPDLESDPFYQVSVRNNLFDRLGIAGMREISSAVGSWFPAIGRRATQPSPVSKDEEKLIEPFGEREFRRMTLTGVLPAILLMNAALMIPRRGDRSPVWSDYPDGPLGTATLIFMRFVAPILIALIAWYLIRTIQKVVYARITRPERLLKFFDCGRCPACLGDLLNIEPDPADGCRVCPNCGGAWRLPPA